MQILTLLGALGASLLLSGAATAGTQVEIVWRGEVEFNQINSGVLGDVNSGDSAEIRFLVDSDDFVDSTNFPTRGYFIDRDSFSVTFPNGTIALQDPLPANDEALFVIRNNDPVSDGFFLGNNVDGFPNGVATDQVGAFENFRMNAAVTYGDDPLPTLDVLDAQGSYDFGGLQVFSFSMLDGPFDAMGLIFESLTIEAQASAWSDQGSALAGAAGEPVLTGSGDLVPGSANSVELSNAAPNAAAAVFVAASSTPIPFKGGMLVPNPFLPPSMATTSGTGEVSVAFHNPTGSASGSQLWVQWAIADAGAPAGVALSNALQGTTP